MDNSKLSLSVPFIPQLDQQTPEQIIATLDELGARRTIECLNWKDQFPYKPLTAISIAHSGTTLYIDYAVRCNYLRAVNHTNNSSVHQDSCVEFFVCPDGQLPYYNFEFNCIGTIHAACRQDRHNGTPLSDAQLDKVRRYPSVGTRPFEEMQGMFMWNLLVAIPFEVMNVKYEGKPVNMKGNFYKCADLTAAPHFLSWAPINTPEPDFHRPEFFADITLE
ncbi:MAG: carbohydrate-binding family 9-like protein [Bacteroides sp.]|nr:carbohydrate-binding family 9-like protein [Bacteroides sp.]MCM1413129.1 carbohydrate-binding family 9-like protein [Bacteroides sp.]MCM1472129.1 carbohydrate-binding family 9-like protein [Bacteroides sp.]